MPRRGDFEIEYDNDAELLLAEMEFNDDDSELERDMKFRLIDIYNRKLNERIKRKNFVIAMKLLDLREQLRLDKTRTREEKEVHNLMKAVARFNTPEEHEKLVSSILREKQIRTRIAELKEMIAKGVRTWGEVEDELEGKKKKDDRKKKEDNPVEKVNMVRFSQARPAE
jgi:transcriptional adapter 2-alpha